VEAIKRFIIIYIKYLITTSIVKQIMLFFLLIDKLNLCFVHVSQYFLQFLLNVHYYIRRLYIISNILFKFLALKDKYNKNKLLILDKIDSFATIIKIVTKLMRQIFEEKSNLIDQNIINKTILFYLCLVQINKIFKKKLFKIYVKFIK